MAKVILATVAGGKIYEIYADRLRHSAEEFFHPSDDVEFHILNGLEGWPNGTLFRYHQLMGQLEWDPNDYIFLCDADMQFEGPVGPEILGDGITAVQHPGYVNMLEFLLPYERNTDSAAYTRSGTTYYAGGFVGGKGVAMELLCYHMADAIGQDIANGIISTWHDESHLNCYLAKKPPAVTLTPAYCHPDRDEGYLGMWPEPYERLLVALDKTRDERGNR